MLQATLEVERANADKISAITRLREIEREHAVAISQLQELAIARDKAEKRARELEWILEQRQCESDRLQNMVENLRKSQIENQKLKDECNHLEIQLKRYTNEIHRPLQPLPLMSDAGVLKPITNCIPEIERPQLVLSTTTTTTTTTTTPNTNNTNNPTRDNFTQTSPTQTNTSRPCEDFEIRLGQKSIELEKVKVQLSESESSFSKLQRTLEEMANTIHQKNTTIDQLDELLHKGEAVRNKLHETVETLTKTIQQRNISIEQLEMALTHSEHSRRGLHNQVQELKGNIRVFCRVRPILSEDNGPSAEIEFPDANREGRSLTIVSPQFMGITDVPKKFMFTFDKVFHPSSAQKDIFAELSPVVQSAIDGYRVCVFAYGQTGSGKTYTMHGPQSNYSDPQHRGILHLSVDQILKISKQNTNGWDYRLTATFVEIYNEKIRDLLSSEDTKIHIKHETDGNTYLQNATVVDIVQEDETVQILSRAMRERAVAYNKYNQHSSRSHSVFTLHIEGVSPRRDQTTHGVLNIIDLAGSERMESTGPTDMDRVKETQAINKSLACLGDVIAALANKSNVHIPYRNSKLTYMLQNSLGNGSKVLMFVNVSPIAGHVNESICSLRFASKVNSCEVGPSRKNIVMEENR
eukprot:NODE_857_length_2296_cov_45.049701_g731_i0.p1 GENE.NODE_857_length_2296_cov_45.049701_g731_i0~~NODE_857_length_2296_cov_45.049701_g731_i0.p1  ORF type:complete len:730 (-),score=148.81 NODE_857_length_2296_cov_45.049701_g731_i0:107-2017(-)